jgi:CPA1 family monovalent cation:H+ antiporter
LILYRFAVAAVATGLFSLSEAAGTFALIVVGEISYGIAIGWLSLHLRRWARDPRVEITLSLMTPYVAFLLPAQLGGSGVLATVATGLYVSWNGPLLIPAATRLQGIFFWDLLVYVLEGLIFLVTGLQLRTLLDRPDIFPFYQPILAVLLTVVVIVIARFVWVYPAAYLPRWLSAKVARRDPLPPWQWLFFLAFVGVRGVVSLAAALAIPLTTNSGAPFPYRDLILFITFGIIVITLVGQGLVLPKVVRWLDLGRHAADERDREQKAELAARSDALQLAQTRLEELAADNRIPAEALAILRARHHYRFGGLPKAQFSDGDAASAAANTRSDLIALEREYIYRLLREGRITDEARRRIERELDLEEASIASKEEGMEPPL